MINEERKIATYNFPKFIPLHAFPTTISSIWPTFPFA
jgi:hypothetical protein